MHIPNCLDGYTAGRQCPMAPIHRCGGRCLRRSLLLCLLWALWAYELHVPFCPARKQKRRWCVFAPNLLQSLGLRRGSPVFMAVSCSNRKAQIGWFDQYVGDSFCQAETTQEDEDSVSHFNFDDALLFYMTHAAYLSPLYHPCFQSGMSWAACTLLFVWSLNYIYIYTIFFSAYVML